MICASIPKLGTTFPRHAPLPRLATLPPRPSLMISRLETDIHATGTSAAAMPRQTTHAT
jgi:hypothetical protein